MDPFQSSLKEHLLQELMFQHLTGNEVKQLFEVSTLWNEIASESKKCGEKLKMTIYNDDEAEKLKIIKTSARKYGMVCVKPSEEVQQLGWIHPLGLEIVKSIAWGLKKLEVSCSMTIDDIKQLLSSMCNLETLILHGMIISRAAQPSSLHVIYRQQLPKLKELKVIRTELPILQLFSDVTTLETFEFDSMTDVNLMLEDFILRQEKLKNFCWERNQRNFFKDKNRLKEVKFQLETISATTSAIHPNSAAEFFNRQKNLKSVKLIHRRGNFCGTPEEFLQVLRSIFTLPKLETLKIYGLFINSYWIPLREVRNTVPKFLELKTSNLLDETVIDGKLVEMFPNLQRITVKRVSSLLNLKDIRCESLSLIKCAKNISKVIYNLPFINVDQTLFEMKLEEFLVDYESIEALAIGCNEWITMNIKLSLSFWERILYQLPKLAKLDIYHPGNVKDLVNLLKNIERNFTSVQIFTNDIGDKSTEDIKLPSWMTIPVVA
jgi:hypothetical protein